MTTRSEVLAYARDLAAPDALNLLTTHERWFRQRGDRQAARYWAGEDSLAQIAADNYADAQAIRDQRARRT